VYVSPTVVGDRVYAASCSGKLFALDRERGEVRWSFDTGATFHGEPVVASGLLVIPSDAGFVYAFDLASGEVRWKSAVPPPGVLSDLVRAGPTVAGLDGAGQLFSLDLATGALRWLFPPEGVPVERPRVRTPLAAADRILFAGSLGEVYAVDALSGEPIWKRELGTAVSTGLALAGEAAVVGTEDGRLLRLALTDGSVLSRLELPARPAETPVVTPRAVLVLAGSALLVAVDPALEAVRWSLPSAAGWSSPRPLVVGDTVVAGAEDGEVLALGIADGSIAWRGSVEGVVRGLGGGEDALLIGTLAGSVYAYRPPRAAGRSPAGAPGGRAGRVRRGDGYGTAGATTARRP
jgi:outer membrane protein assembly factor BamB